MAALAGEVVLSLRDNESFIEHENGRRKLLRNLQEESETSIRKSTNERCLNNEGMSQNINIITTHTSRGKRKTWSKQMNSDIIKCYFKSMTLHENDHLSNLYTYWNDIYPNTLFTKQRIHMRPKESNI